MEKIHISDGGWKAMSALWDIYPATLAELTKALEDETGWTQSTVFVTMRRLVTKGLVEIDNGGKYQTYVPRISRREAIKWETDRFLSRHYKGSVESLVLFLLREGHWDLEQIEEIRLILDETEAKLRENE